MPIVFFILKIPLFPPSIKFLPILLLPCPGFYSSPVSIIFSLSSSPPLAIPLLLNFNSLLKPAIFYLRFLFSTCDFFYLLPFKTISIPEIPSTFINFCSIYPRFNLSVRFVFHPFERSFAWKNLENAKNSPEIMQFDNPNRRQNPMILCFTT